MYEGERLNSISHLAGSVLATAGTAWLVVEAVMKGDPWKIAGVSIYGATLILLYLSSTIYHSVQGRAKRIFQKFDHGSIYLLIAGSYTPFSLVTLRGPWGWSILIAVWVLATIGIVIDTFHEPRRRIIPLVIYFLMGWLVVIVIRPLLRALPTAGFVWLLTGGILYSAGVLFYAFDRRIPYGHAIWHLFVLAGSSAQFVAVAIYVV